MKAKALVLDMDGVLIDSNPLHAQAWLQYLSQYEKAADSMLERMHGKRNDQIVRELFGEDLSEDEVFAHGAAEGAGAEFAVEIPDGEAVGGGVELVVQGQGDRLGLHLGEHFAHLRGVQHSHGVSCTHDSTGSTLAFMSVMVNVNGRLMTQEDAVISVFDHGFLYGEGVYEVVRTYEGVLFLFDRHMRRLRASGERIHLDLGISDDALERRCAELEQQLQRALSLAAEIGRAHV